MTRPSVVPSACWRRLAPTRGKSWKFFQQKNKIKSESFGLSKPLYRVSDWKRRNLNFLVFLATMEEANIETEKPSQTLIAFPPHCRRHLKSGTYRTLVRILSHCYDESQHSAADQNVPQELNQGRLNFHNSVFSFVWLLRNSFFLSLGLFSWRWKWISSFRK